MSMTTTTHPGDLTHEQYMYALTHTAYAHGVFITIDGERYRGVHTRRAIRAAMTKAGADVCYVSTRPNELGVSWNKAGLAYVGDLG